MILTLFFATSMVWGQNDVRYWFDQQTSKQILSGAEVDCSMLTTGVHFVHLQIEGTDGMLSPVRSHPFIVINEALTPSSTYSRINYWFDQQNVKTTYTGGNIDCSSLSNGFHAIHFQLIDSNGMLCPVRTQYFVNLNYSAQQLYYWFDDATTHSQLDIKGTEINVEDLAYGHHTLHAMLANSKGNVVSTEEQTADFVIVCPDGEHVDASNDGICDVCDEILFYTRTTTEGRYGTICLPKGASEGDITGATFYSIAGKRVNGSGLPTSIVLDEVSNIEAGKPYIFLGSGSAMHVTYSGMAAAEAGSENGLVGSFTGQDVEEGMYLLSNNVVVKCGTGCSIGANRAYINMDEVPEYNGAVTAKMAVIGFDSTVGIEDVIVEGNAVRYNLSGIRIPAGTKGIVIVNGQKTLSK